jgi:SAM-dependent methyltransferase
MIAEATLREIVSDDIQVRLIEPDIYSIYSQPENVGSYDKFGNVYDVVACNRLYNRIMWGYWISDFHTLCLDALTSTKHGWVLDLGCGSLAFTARTYDQYQERPIVMLDQSIRLLRMARERLVQIHGRVPDNVVFFHGDALDLPFKPQTFTTIVSMNLLHVLQDPGKLLLGLKDRMADNATASFSTLVKNGRFSDHYLTALGKSGAVVPRSVDQVLAIFDAATMPVQHRVMGNMAFIHYK